MEIHDRDSRRSSKETLGQVAERSIFNIAFDYVGIPSREPLDGDDVNGACVLFQSMTKSAISRTHQLTASLLLAAHG